MPYVLDTWPFKTKNAVNLPDSTPPQSTIKPPQNPFYIGITASLLKLHFIKVHQGNRFTF